MISGLYSYVTAWKRGKHLLEDRLFRIGADAVDGNVCSFKLLLLTEADADGFGENAVHEKAVGQGEKDSGQGSATLRDQGYPAHAAGEEGPHMTLKPNQPTARIQEPRERNGMLLTGIGCDLPRT